MRTEDTCYRCGAVIYQSYGSWYHNDPNIDDDHIAVSSWDQWRQRMREEDEL